MKYSIVASNLLFNICGFSRNAIVDAIRLLSWKTLCLAFGNKLFSVFGIHGKFHCGMSRFTFITLNMISM